MIYVSHGIIEELHLDKFCHRQLLDRYNFCQFLEQKQKKFVSIKDAINGYGDAFTIDDSTYASLEAAEMMRDYDHAVTLFINPFYIHEKLNYWFSILNYLLDKDLRPSVCLNNNHYPFSSFKERSTFRKILKSIICTLKTEEERQQYLSKFFNTNINNITLPHHLTTINVEDLIRLKKIGVDIQNHGWTHRYMATASYDEVDEEIFKGKLWLKEKIQVEAEIYAAPFGDALPPKDCNYNLFEYWLLVDSRFEVEGRIGKKIYNRKTFKIK